MEAQVRRYAKDGDLEMLRSLEMIMCGDGRHENLFLKTFWTAAMYGRFIVVSYLLSWWWRDGRPAAGPRRRPLHGSSQTWTFD